MRKKRKDQQEEMVVPYHVGKLLFRDHLEKALLAQGYTPKQIEEALK